MRAVSFFLILAVALVGSGCNRSEPPKATAPVENQQATSAPITAAVPAQTREQIRAVAEIEQWGGTVKRLKDVPNNPVVEVDLYGKAVPNAVFQHLNVLKDLQTLDLAGTQMGDEGLEYLANLYRLKSLNLSGTDVTNTGMAYLRGFTDLQQLYLGDTKVTDLEQLQGLTKLQRLGLNGTLVTDAALDHLAELTDLRFLNLQHNPNVTDAGMEYLLGLKQLQTLYVDHTSVTDRGVNKLQKALPACKIQLQLQH